MSDFLLDTHVALWAVYQPHTISPSTHDIMTDTSVIKWISMASIWEIAIKKKLEKPGFNFVDHDFVEAFVEASLQVLNITTEDALLAGSLPLIHTDPFDRMLVAQANNQTMTLMTADQKLWQHKEAFGIDMTHP